MINWSEFCVYARSKSKTSKENLWSLCATVTLLLVAFPDY